MNRYDGKVVVVTGASSGIGEATAASLRAAGARVYGLASRGETLAAARTRHPDVSWLAADLAKPSEVGAVVAEIARETAKVDALVNNAGVYAFAPLEGSDDGMVRRHFEINVFALITLTQGLLPLLKEARGTIVNVSSTSARKAMPNQSIYAATKAAVEALTRCWAVELAPSGVRVNAIAPGPTETPGIASLPFPKEVIASIREQIRTSLPLGRFARPEEIAHWIVALADPSVTWLTGQVLAVDGGQTVA